LSVAGWESFVNLERVELHSFFTQIPPALQALKEARRLHTLKLLYVRGEEELEGLASLTQLTALDVRYSLPEVTCLQALPNLRILATNQAYDVPSLTSLTCLSLHNAFDLSSSLLAPLTRLQYLSVRQALAPPVLLLPPSLRFLGLYNVFNQSDRSHCIDLPTLSSLTALNLDNTALSVRAISAATNLAVLGVPLFKLVQQNDCFTLDSFQTNRLATGMPKTRFFNRLIILPSIVAGNLFLRSLQSFRGWNCSLPTDYFSLHPFEQ